MHYFLNEEERICPVKTYDLERKTDPKGLLENRKGLPGFDLPPGGGRSTEESVDL
jgi:hypothetical protein